MKIVCLVQIDLKTALHVVMGFDCHHGEDGGGVGGLEHEQDENSDMEKTLVYLGNIGPPGEGHGLKCLATQVSCGSDILKERFGYDDLKQ